MKSKKLYILFTFFGYYINFASSVLVKDTNFLACLKTNYPNIIKNEAYIDTDLAGAITGSLNFSGKNIKYIDEIVYFKNLTSVNFFDNSIESIPSLSNIINLDYLNLSNNNLTRLPELNPNKKLVELIVYDNQLTILPNLDSLIKLEYIDVVDNQLTSLPSLDNCTVLEKLLCNKNKLSALPDLSKSTNIKAIDASYNRIIDFPDLKNCQKLIVLNINDNLISYLPELPVLPFLQKIFLDYNYLKFSQLNKLLVYSNYESVFRTAPQYATSKKYTLSKVKGDSLIIVDTTDQKTQGVSYMWYKKGNATPISNTNSLNFKSLTLSDSGIYYCRIKSLYFSYNVEIGDSVYLKVDKCANFESFDVIASNITCASSGKITITPANKYTFVLFDLTKKDSIVTNNGQFTSLNTQYFKLKISQNIDCYYDYGNIELQREVCDQVLITPNEDGDTDEYYFSQTGNVKIFNKRGDLVKQIKIPAYWNASNKNGILPQGFYIADINDGEKIVKISIVY